MKKLVYLFLILFFLIPIVKAELLITEYNYSFYYSEIYIRENYPSTSSYLCAYGEEFKVPISPNDTWIDVNFTYCVFWLRKIGTPNGTLQAWLMSHKSASTFGYNGVVENILAVSDNLSTTEISTFLPHTPYQFNFSEYVLEKDTVYGIVLVALDGIDVLNHVRVGRGGSYPIFSGSQQLYSYSKWSNAGYNYDCCFQVWGNYDITEEDGEYTEVDLENHFILGGIFIFLIITCVVLIIIEQKKK